MTLIVSHTAITRFSAPRKNDRLLTLTVGPVAIVIVGHKREIHIARQQTAEAGIAVLDNDVTRQFAARVHPAVQCGHN